MQTLFIAFLISFITTFLVVRFRHVHEKMSGDYDLKGIQKFHSSTVPRIGGMCILLGLLSSAVMLWISNRESSSFNLFLLLSSIPAFGIGFLEDITKKVSISIRLFATTIAALIAGFLLNSWINNLEIDFLDTWIKQFPLIGMCITCVAVVGVTNSFNIIDGYNGLSSMVGIIILLGISCVALQLNDQIIMTAALAMAGAILGFFVWNFPRGLIFLGDGGAYLIGFWIAELSILLIARNPTISVWFPVLLCAYPIFETLFSIYRRAILSKSHPGMADSSHLHHLIYKRLVRWKVGSRLEPDRLVRNSLTTPYLWTLCLFSVVPAVLFWDETLSLQFFTVLFLISYYFLYRAIVRFSVPEWMILNKK
jgi:UDP-N-acetylmuramyl pentapeptide phosphotransferase/UDP-N-acetylglucosamine-1-phosphate transferase